MGRLLVKKRQIAGCTPPPGMKSKSWCEEVYTEWCDECPPGTMKWKRFDLGRLKPMRQLGPREIQFNFALDQIRDQLDKVQLEMQEKRFSDARETLLAMMLAAGEQISKVDLVQAERGRNETSTDRYNGPG